MANFDEESYVNNTDTVALSLLSAPVPLTAGDIRRLVVMGTSLVLRNTTTGLMPAQVLSP